jgi:hypothetical protein
LIEALQIEHVTMAERVAGCGNFATGKGFGMAASGQLRFVDGLAN